MIFKNKIKNKIWKWYKKIKKLKIKRKKIDRVEERKKNYKILIIINPKMNILKNNIIKKNQNGKKNKNLKLIKNY